MKRFGVLSRGILRIPHLAALAGAEIVPVHRWRVPPGLDAIAGWGRRPGTAAASALAARKGLPFVALEDGFLRSVGLGAVDPPLSLVLDDAGVYYDAGSPSRLERLVREPLDSSQVLRARELARSWRAGRVSKYNAVRDATVALPERFVLVADQTRGDASVTHGMADAGSFARMLEAALDENPHAEVLVKIHPGVFAGKARGYFVPEQLPRTPRLRVLQDDVHPASLLERAEAVYVATSQLGFEGLLWGIRVRVFGMPFYAGWGLSADDQQAPARRGPASLEQLAHAALVRYPRYVDPDSGEPCEAERVLEHIALQRRMQARYAPTLHACGFSPWKRPLVRAFLRGSRVRFHRAGARVPDGSTAVVWGRRACPSGAASLVRLEDGFLRSVGLGADLVQPLSWVADARGMHYDPAQASQLEHLLQATGFDAPLLARAARLRERIVATGLSKYNLVPVRWQRPPGVQRVILVPGQVESDAAVALAGSGLRSNAALVEAARAAAPDAWIVYKPHPDVVAGLRRRGLDEDAASRVANETLASVSIAGLLDAVDEVHVISSLAGFEALLRGRRVVCHGQPFYAGWGLTDDRNPPARRTRQLQLDELVAGALILYPTYLSRSGRHFVSPERALEELLAWRLDRGGLAQRLRHGMLRPLLRLRARFDG